MLRSVLLVLVGVGLASCNELPPPPSAGTGGTGGADGDAGVGGMGGDAGAAGIGGVGGANPCAVVVPERYADLEVDDIVQQSTAIGRVNGVCPGVPCNGDDPIDRWSITTCGGEHRIRLWWDTPANDLSLFVFTEDDSDSWSSQGTSVPEVISEELSPSAEYVIQVQAANTNENPQTYEVTVTPLD